MTSCHNDIGRYEEWTWTKTSLLIQQLYFSGACRPRDVVESSGRSFSSCCSDWFKPDLVTSPLAVGVKVCFSGWTSETNWSVIKSFNPTCFHLYFLTEICLMISLTFVDVVITDRKKTQKFAVFFNHHMTTSAINQHHDELGVRNIQVCSPHRSLSASAPHGRAACLN